MEFDRGQVWWVRLDPTQGSEIQKTRPCVIIVVRPIARARRTLVVVPLTTRGTPRFPLVVPVQCQARTVYAVTDQIRAVDKTRFSTYVETLSDEDMGSIEAALRQVVGL
ncbi:MAG TPA: type II toxin-antitoxin system PemK/MazF family toxin [Roseiflexaceae bacterium]